MSDYTTYLYLKNIISSLKDVSKKIKGKKNSIFKNKDLIYCANYDRRNKSLKKIRNLSKRKVGEYSEY